MRKELDSSNFVSIQNKISNLKLDIRYYGDYNFVGTRIDGYKKPLALLTMPAFVCLYEANKEFEKLGYGILVYDAYRPVKAVEHFKRWAKDVDDIKMKKEFYPDVNKKDLFALDYIAEKSSHSRGSTIDLTLYDLISEEVLDMGTPFDFFSETSHSDYTETLTSKQIKNRKLLKDTMVKHGFSPLYSEWWHFTMKIEPYQDTYFEFDIDDNVL